MGKVIVITGAGSGLGRAMARRLAREGHRLVLLGRSLDKVQAVAEEIGGGAWALSCDVGKVESVTEAFAAIAAREPQIDVLINNAAGNFPAPAEEMTPNGFRTVVDIVLNGTYNCSREFAIRRLAAGLPGAILNIGATYSWTGGPGTSHSAAAKAGVANLTQSLAVEWAPDGIRVNCIAPGRFPHEDLPDHMTRHRVGERDVLAGLVVERAVRLDVGDAAAFGRGHPGERADLVDHHRFEFGRRPGQVTPAEALQVGIGRMGTNGDTMLQRQ